VAEEYAAVDPSTTLPVVGPSAPSGDPLTDILRREARALLAQAVEAELAAYLQARAHLKDDSGRQQVVRNGYLPERTVLTGVGPVEVKQPRVRDRRPAAERETFSSAILPPYLRKTKTLEDLKRASPSREVAEGCSTPFGVVGFAPSPIPRRPAATCSTPFGVVVGFAVQDPGRGRPPAVLNAFRRRRRLRADLLLQRDQVGLVLNAFRRRRRLRLRDQGLQPRAPGVLNVFRRRRLRAAGEGRGDEPDTVLHAFRRRRRLRQRHAGDARRQDGAQRLSASSSASLVGGL
jgi:hypothetical protein